MNTISSCEQLSNQEAKDVDLGVLRALNSVQALVHAEEFDRVRVGLVLRALRPHWGICRDVALARELVDSRALSPDHQDDQIRRRYDAFTASVVASGLDDIASQSLLFTVRSCVRLVGCGVWGVGCGVCGAA